MWYVKRNDETSKGEKIGGTNLIGREERRSMRLSGTRNMNRFLVRTCLLGITVLKYDLIALLVPWNLAQHSINYGNARFDYIIIILWNLIYFPTFCVFIFIYIYSEIFEFSKRSKQRFSKAWETKPRVVSLRGAKTRDVIDFRVSSSCIRMHRFDERCSSSRWNEIFRKLFLPNRNKSLKVVLENTSKYAF